MEWERRRPPEQIALNGKEYLKGPGIEFLLFLDNYMGGFQGGLQLLQNGERVLDTGNVLLGSLPGTAASRPGVVRRDVDRAAGAATVIGEIPEWDSGYRLTTRTGGRHSALARPHAPGDGAHHQPGAAA